MSIAEFIEIYRILSIREHLESIEISLAGTHGINSFSPLNLFQYAHMFPFLNDFAGRIINKRASSSMLFFYDLYGDGGCKVSYSFILTVSFDFEDETEN